VTDLAQPVGGTERVLRPLPERVRSSGWLWPLTTLSCVVALGLVSTWTSPPPIVAPWDVFTLLDGGYRISRGEIPSVDFGNPIGPLLYELIALGMRIQTTPSLAAIAYGNLLFLVVASWLAWSVARPRLSGPWSAVFTVFVASTVVAVRPLGFSPSITTYAMLYNRYGWVLYATILVQALIPPVRPWTGRRQTVEGLVLGLSSALLLYTKITFFLASVAAAAVGLLFGAIPRTARILTSTALGLLAVGTVMRWAFGVRLVAYLGDVADAARTQGEDQRLLALARGIYHTLPVSIVTLVVLSAMLVVARRHGVSQRPLADVAVAAAYVLTSSVLLTAGDAYEREDLPALVVLPLLLVARSQLPLPQRPSGRTATNGSPTPTTPHTAALPRLAGASVLLALTAGLIGTKDVTSLGRAVAQQDVVAHPPQTQRFAAEPLHDFVIPADTGYQTAYRPSKTVPTMQNDGLALLRRHLRPGDRVFTTAMTDPFSFALRLQPPEGGMLWWDVGYDVDSDTHPTPDRVLGKVDWVMIPQLHAGQGCCQKTVELMIDVYSGYLSTHFRDVERTSDWVLLTRIRSS
jgi:hypothetical protein